VLELPDVKELKLINILINNIDSGADVQYMWYNGTIKRNNKEYNMYKTNKRNFDITMKQTGRSKWYTAVHVKEDGERIVYVRNNLSSLKAFIKAKGDTPNVRFW